MVAYGAAVQHDHMADGDMFAHQQRPTWVGVADAAVLDIAARAYADARVARIYGGANEIMKEIISRTL